MTVLIDSWAWIEYFTGGPHGDAAREHIEGDEDAIASTITVAEVTHALLQRSQKPDKYLRFLTTRALVIPPTTQIAVAAAHLKHERKMGMADAFILATAQARDAAILTGDPDFKDVPSVRYIGP